MHAGVINSPSVKHFVQNMHLFVSFLVVTSVYGTSRISMPNLKAVNFAHAIEGRLNGSVIKEIEVDSEISCQFECVEEVKCYSYNFGPIKDNTKTFKCQLSNSDRFAGFVNFTEDNNFKYRGLQVEQNYLTEKPVIV